MSTLMRLKKNWKGILANVETDACNEGNVLDWIGEQTNGINTTFTGKDWYGSFELDDDYLVVPYSIIEEVVEVTKVAEVAEEAKFVVEISPNGVNVGGLNQSAIDVWKEFKTLFPGVSVLNFILMSDNSMGMVKGELIYDVDLLDKEAVFDRLRYQL